MNPYEVRNFLREVLVSNQDHEVGSLMLEVKNFKSVHNLNPDILLFQAIHVILDSANLHKTKDVSEWHTPIQKQTRPFKNLWNYTTQITDSAERAECIFQIFEYCQNPKRPHLKKGFPYIVSTLSSEQILCPLSVAEFIDAMTLSDDDSEKEVGDELKRVYSNSCPW